MIRTTLVSLAVLAAASCTTSQDPHDLYPSGQRPVAGNRAAQKLTSDRLETFASEKEFLDYVRKVRDIATREDQWWAGKMPPLPPAPPPPPQPAAAVPSIAGATVQDFTNFAPGLSYSPSQGAPAAAYDPVVVTANKREDPSEETITNVQKAGVDEGDIVKRIGNYLVVLQDGRLFSIDMRPGGQAALKLAARTNVYTRSDDYSWYDEMLVTGDRVLVTSYSYEEDGTKLSVFRIGADGRFTAEGAFVISSNDYYSVDNYASRLVDGKLVIYSPLDLRDVDPDRPMQWPLVRRWRKDQPHPEADGARLFDARAIYKPMQPTLDPVVHTVSVCDLGDAADAGNVPCRATAIVAPGNRAMYVSPTDAFIWSASSDNLWDEMCSKKVKLSFDDGPEAGLYRLPLSGAKPTMMFTHGMPQDQFAMDTSSDEMRALVVWGRTNCDVDDYEKPGEAQVKYFSAPLSQFRDDVRTPARYRYVDAPAPGGEAFENRFTDGYAVYGSRNDAWSYPPEDGEAPRSSQIVALPVAHPDKPTIVTAPHGVMRAERVGNNMVLTGYRDDKGLSLSYLDLSATPRIASTEVLADRYEAENRSHAFNSRVDQDGGGLVGIPTVVRVRESGRWWWRSDSSDLSYLHFNAAGKLEAAGELLTRKDSQDPSYKCEVSCIDWYGNSRPFFISGRIYALMGTELVEGALAEGRMVEVRRVNLTGKVG